MNEAQHELNISPVFNPAAPMQRISQRPGFIPLKTGDPIPDALRKVLNVEAYVRELRLIAREVIESELEP